MLTQLFSSPLSYPILFDMLSPHTFATLSYPIPSRRGRRISPTGTGAELQAAFEGAGSIRSKDIASWWIQEETFDNLCMFLGESSHS